MLRVESIGPVLRLTLDRPEVRNALNDELIARITDAVTSAGAGTRVIVFAGEGKSFCAGGDLQWMQKAANYTYEENVADAMGIAAMFQAIVNSHAPVVAQVQGAAFGGGAGIVAVADVAIAAEGTLFSFSEARLGLIPATISTHVIPKIGSGNARAYFTTAEAFGAHEALRIGLIHAVAKPEELIDTVESKVKAILRNGPEAVAASKRLVLDAPISIEESARRLAEARCGDEGREGVAAFLEKRLPEFVVEP